MDQRHWLLTSTTYGNWLPGDARGFVSGVRNPPHPREVHNTPATDYDADMPRLQAYARSIAKGPRIVLTPRQADALLIQFHETARHRGWGLRAIGILRTHIHIVVGVPGDPDPDRVLGNFKAYGSRKLNRGWERRRSGTWWTEKGSTRKLGDERAILAAVEYVRRQPNPLVIWIAGEDLVPELPPASGAGVSPPVAPNVS